MKTWCFETKTFLNFQSLSPSSQGILFSSSQRITNLDCAKPWHISQVPAVFILAVLYPTVWADGSKKLTNADSSGLFGHVVNGWDFRPKIMFSFSFPDINVRRSSQISIFIGDNITSFSKVLHILESVIIYYEKSNL